MAFEGRFQIGRWTVRDMVIQGFFVLYASDGVSISSDTSFSSPLILTLSFFLSISLFVFFRFI